MISRITSREKGILPVALIDNSPFTTSLYDGGFIQLDECFIPGRGTLRESENGISFLAKNLAGEFYVTCRGDEYEVTISNHAGIFPTFSLQKSIIRKPIKGVMLDLDGTCVSSEKFWIKIILETTNFLLAKYGHAKINGFSHEELPFISGRTVPEHLMYCIDNYCPQASLDEMQEVYTELAEDYMIHFNNGNLDSESFVPVDGLKEFLLFLKEHDIKIAIVTSGLYYKAWPELKEAMKTLGLGDPTQFFDAIITSGTLAGKGRCGTMGNAIAKPWPNIYYEAAQIIGFNMDEREHFIGIGDSCSDVGSVRLMGAPFIGIDGGNIRKGGMTALCTEYVTNMNELKTLFEKILN